MQGDLIKITGLLRNNGSETETFIVRCYYGAPELPPIQIGSDQGMTLNPGEEGGLEFVWDTSGVDPGTYWIEIRAIPVVGELDTDDNTCAVEAPVTIMARAIQYVGGEITSPFGFNASETTMMFASILLILAILVVIALLSRKSIESHP